MSLYRKRFVVLVTWMTGLSPKQEKQPQTTTFLLPCFTVDIWYQILNRYFTGLLTCFFPSFPTILNLLSSLHKTFAQFSRRKSEYSFVNCYHAALFFFEISGFFVGTHDLKSASVRRRLAFLLLISDSPEPFFISSSMENGFFWIVTQCWESVRFDVFLGLPLHDFVLFIPWVWNCLITYLTPSTHIVMTSNFNFLDTIEKRAHHFLFSFSR